MGVRPSVALLLVVVLGCGRSVRATEEDGSAAGEGGTSGLGSGGAAGSSASGGSATGGLSGTTGSGGSASGGVAGTFANGGSATGGAAGAPASGGSSTGGVAGTAGDGGSATGGDGGFPDVPGHDDFIVRSDLMAAYEGLPVYATFDFNFGENSRSDARSDVITNGAFELRWVEGFDRNSFGAYVVLFVDRGTDALCTSGVDSAWVHFQSNLSEPGTPQTSEFNPAPDNPSLGPITCEEFNTWFGEDYRPPSL